MRDLQQRSTRPAGWKERFQGQYMFTPAQCMLRMLIREGIGMGEVLPSDLISPFKLSYHYGVLLNVVKHLRFERHSKILQGFNFTAINK